MAAQSDPRSPIELASREDEQVRALARLLTLPESDARTEAQALGITAAELREAERRLEAEFEDEYPAGI